MSYNEQNYGKKEKRTGRAKPALETMVYGKIPPQAKELEQVILGAITLEKHAFDAAAEILQPEHFYLDVHQRVYRAMQQLIRKSLPIDLLTLAEELKVSGDLEQIGGYQTLTKLQDKVVSSANIASHCKIVYQKYVSREIIRISGEAIAEAYDDETDPFDQLETVEQRFSGLSLSKTGKQFETLAGAAVKAVEQIYKAQQSGDELTGVPSGLPVLDTVTQGWQPTNLIIIAARPGVGKSALAGNLAMNAAAHPVKPVPTGVFSLEMATIQWVTRLLSGSTHVPMYDMKRGRIDDAQMKKLQTAAMIDYPEIPVYFDDTAGLDIYQLKSKARIMVLRYKVGLLIVDYLQLMGGKKLPGESREQEVARISKELKQLAKELNIPIIALAQLSRQGDTGEPRLGHLRESGAIEQDADDVLFLTAPEQNEIDADASLKDSILVHIAKHRNGTLEKIPIKFVRAIQKLMTENEYERYMTGRFPVGSNRKASQPGFFPNPDKTHEPEKNDSIDDIPF
ncbi:MAG TPA: replicative DNA helicase [Puia sp.]|nr:replicative DNA helicase [Puia sp.]